MCEGCKVSLTIATVNPGGVVSGTLSVNTGLMKAGA